VPDKNPKLPVGKSIQISAVVLLVYLLFAVHYLGPLDIRKEVWGATISDTFLQVNTLAWQAREAAHGRLFPFFTKDLRYPEGGSLFVADPMGGTLVIPVTWVFGPVVAYNLLILIDLLFAGWAMFWLANRRIGDRWIAFFCGTVYGFNPTLISDVAHGSTEVLQAGWVPLFLGTLLSLMDEAQSPEKNRKKILRLMIATAVFWWFAAVSSHWYYGLAAGLLFGLMLIGRLASQPSPKIIVPALGALALTLVLILPVGWIFYHISHDPDSLTNKLSVKIWSIIKFNCVDPVSFFPSRPIRQLYHGGYLGIILPLTILAGLITWSDAGKKKPIWVWLGAAVFFIVFSIGPTLFYNGQDVVVFGYTFTLPFHWLRTAFPLLQSIQHPWRFFLFVYLCLGMAAGWSMKRWLPHNRWRRWVVAALAVLFILKVTYYSGLDTPLMRSRIETYPVLENLAADPEEFAVFDLPVDYGRMQSYARDQIIHGRPIIYSAWVVHHYYSQIIAHDSLIFYVLSRENPYKDSEEDPVLAAQAEELIACISKPDQPCDKALLAKLAKDKMRLVKLGVTRFVLHLAYLAPDSSLQAICRFLFGQPAADFQQVQLYKLNPPATGYY